MFMGEYVDYMGVYGMQMFMLEVSDLVCFDMVQQIVCVGGIDFFEIEICLLCLVQQVWVVWEVDCFWLIQVDMVVIDVDCMVIISWVDFVDFLLIVKLICWGVDVYMGVLFGVVNQILMVFFGVVFIGFIVLGYVMWWWCCLVVGVSLVLLMQVVMCLFFL